MMIISRLSSQPFDLRFGIPFRLVNHRVSRTRQQQRLSTTRTIGTRGILTISSSSVVPGCCHQYQHRAVFSGASFNFSGSTRASTSSIHAALDLLNLSSHDCNWTQRELRDAYFTAAKQCHPDAQPRTNDDDDNKDDELLKADLSNKFLEITEAYELLQKHAGEGSDRLSRPRSRRGGNSADEGFTVTLTEEQRFRQACMEYLGIDAEIVEESKRCPMFRKWLKGRSVDAFHWNLFLMKNGGLAPMLRGKKVLNLTEGDRSVNNGSNGKAVPRRRRQRK